MFPKHTTCKIYSISAYSYNFTDELSFKNHKIILRGAWVTVKCPTLVFGSDHYLEPSIVPSAPSGESA